MWTNPTNIQIRTWKAVEGFREQLMYTKSVHYDVAKLIIEIESESQDNGFSVVIEFNEGCISFRTTEVLYLEPFWENYSDVNWRQTFFVIDSSLRDDLIINGEKVSNNYTHYAIYTYDIFFEILTFETPKITISQMLT